MAMSSLEAGILVGCAAVVSSAAPDRPEPMSQALPRATAATAIPSSDRAADMGATCDAMTADHEKMMSEMNAAGQRLDNLVARMNAASGVEKANETAAAVTEMVAQWSGMRNRIARYAAMRPTGGMKH